MSPASPVSSNRKPTLHPGVNKRQIRPVVLTGGTSGIGLETARLLLQGGLYRLCIVAKSDDKLEEARAALIDSLPEGAENSKDLLTFYDCDLANPKSIRSTVEKISAVFSTGLYGLINNAGVYPFGGIESTTEESWDSTMMINLKAAFMMTQGLTPALKKSPWGGRIVNISSTAGILPNHHALAYSVSKAALIQLTRTIAKELGKEGVTVNCVCPGIVRSPMHEAYHRTGSELESFYSKRGAGFPMGRVGEAGDVAGAVEYLLSDRASWVTGDVLVIDGGRLLV